MFRTLAIATIMGAATMLVPKGAHAAGKWCVYDDHAGTNCGFDTYQQCRVTVIGVGGNCGQSR